MPRQRTDISKTVQRNAFCACGKPACININFGHGPWICTHCWQAHRARKGKA